MRLSIEATNALLALLLIGAGLVIAYCATSLRMEQRRGLHAHGTQVHSHRAGWRAHTHK